MVNVPLKMSCYFVLYRAIKEERSVSDVGLTKGPGDRTSYKEKEDIMQP